MSYGRQPPNVTRIEDLQDLEFVGDPGGGGPPRQGPPPDPESAEYKQAEFGSQTQRHIRPYKPLHPGSGMVEVPMPMMGPPEGGQGPPPIREPFLPDPFRFSCLDIAGHIGGCPICSRFYRTDVSIYIIIIVILAFIALLLLKRVLNV